LVVLPGAADVVTDDVAGGKVAVVRTGGPVSVCTNVVVAPAVEVGTIVGGPVRKVSGGPVNVWTKVGGPVRRLSPGACLITAAAKTAGKNKKDFMLRPIENGKVESKSSMLYSETNHQSQPIII